MNFNKIEKKRIFEMIEVIINRKETIKRNNNIKNSAKKKKRKIRENEIKIL